MHLVVITIDNQRNGLETPVKTLMIYALLAFTYFKQEQQCLWSFWCKKLKTDAA